MHRSDEWDWCRLNLPGVWPLWCLRLFMELVCTLEIIEHLPRMTSVTWQQNVIHLVSDK